MNILTKPEVKKNSRLLIDYNSVCADKRDICCCVFRVKHNVLRQMAWFRDYVVAGRDNTMAMRVRTTVSCPFYAL